MIQVKVDQLFLSNLGFVVILKNEGDERSVPIFIGAAEAQAIAIQLQGMQVPRPLTHDLLKNVLDCLECRVKRVEVCDIRDGTFYGRLVVEIDRHDTEIDCRPSDAIALSLRSACPIFVHEKVMEEAGRVMDHVKPEPEGTVIEASETEAEAAEDDQAQRTPLETLNLKLNKAVADERYEDAAKLRDEINRLKKHTDN